MGPPSFLYRPRCTRSVQKRPRADILPVRPRASLVNKRFIIRLKKALKVFHKFHVILCGKCLLVLAVSTAGVSSPSVVVLLKISNSRLKQGFSKSAINSGAIRRHFRKISSSSAILILSSKGHKCGIIRDNARSNT